MEVCEINLVLQRMSLEGMKKTQKSKEGILETSEEEVGQVGQL